MRLFKSKAFFGGICLLVAAGIAFFVIPRFYASQKATTPVVRPVQEIAAGTVISARWKRFGYRRLNVMLEREDIHINHKRTYRFYREAGLSLKRRSKKKRYEKRGMPDRTISTPNRRWSMDFVSDRTRNGGNHAY